MIRLAIIYLAVSLLKQSSCLPFSACRWRHSGGPPSNTDLRGISARKVYPQLALLQTAVSSYLTFSPLPCQWQDGYFLWHSLFPPKWKPAV